MNKINIALKNCKSAEKFNFYFYKQHCIYTECPVSFCVDRTD